MLDVEVIPGKSLGEFRIGMPISVAIAYIQKNYKFIPNVELKYCEEDLLSNHIVIDLKEEGILLRFEPRTQRLHIIEVYDLTKVILRYSNVAFSGPDVQPTFVLIYSRFGPSFPGDFDKNNHIYELHYPGISFSFPIPPRYDVLDETELPLEFEDGTTPLTNRMRLYYGKKDRPGLPDRAPNDLYFEEVRVYASTGRVDFTRRGARGAGCKLDFLSTAQDVVAELGRPDRIFYKHEDKMRIHSVDKSAAGTGCQDYFYNYYALGIDILFDMRNHVVKKFIFHTNFPCHYDFNVYAKCNFRLYFEEPSVLKSGELISLSSGESSADSGSDSLDDLLDESDSGSSPEAPQRKPNPKKKKNSKQQQQQQAKKQGQGKGKHVKGKAKHRKNKDEEEEEEEEEDKGSEEEGLRDGRKKSKKSTHQANSARNGKGKEKETAKSKAARTAASGAKPRGSKEKAGGEAAAVECIDPDMKWERIRDMLPGGGPPSKPVVHSVGATASPFGSTLFYGFRNIIFEVMRNQHVGSICLFSPRQG